MRLRNNFGVLREKEYGLLMKNINNSLAFESSDVAKFRLRCIELLDTHGRKAVLTVFPDISLRSVYRWRRKYLSSQKRLSSLLPASTRPKRLRQMVVPAGILGFIKATRQQHPRMSKYKLKYFLDEFCDDEGLPHYSVSWIGKLIKRYQFFFETRKPIRAKRKTVSKTRVGYCPRLDDVYLGYLQVDGVKIHFNGKTYCFLTAIEIKSREAFVKKVKTFSSRVAREFLEEIVKATQYPIHTIQTDNGSEFAGEFERVIQELGLNHLWSYPKRPKTQGFIERFNGILQQEFLDYELDSLFTSNKVFEIKLQDWLNYYHYQRPHQGLNYQTPNQALQYQLTLNQSS